MIIEHLWIFFKILLFKNNLSKKKSSITVDSGLFKSWTQGNVGNIGRSGGWVGMGARITTYENKELNLKKNIQPKKASFCIEAQVAQIKKLDQTMIPWSTNDGFLYRNRNKYLYKGIEKKPFSHRQNNKRGLVFTIEIHGWKSAYFTFFCNTNITVSYCQDVLILIL